MKTTLAIFFAILISVFGLCNKDDESIVCDECSGRGSETKYMLVNGQYSSCDANEDSLCMMVKFGDVNTTQNYNQYNQYNQYNSGSNYTTNTEYELADSVWNLFTDTICGFDFEPGFEYELEIEQITDSETELTKYCLNRLISKKTVFL